MISRESQDESQRLNPFEDVPTKLNPFRRDLIEDHILIDEYSVGYDEILLKIKKIRVGQLSRRTILFSRILRQFRPTAKLPKARDHVCFAVITHPAH